MVTRGMTWALALACLARLANAGAIYPMEGGGPTHCNAALSPSSLRLPVHTAWVSAACAGTPRQHPIILSDRLILVTQRAVEAFDRASGTILWTWQTSMSDLLNAPAYDSVRDLVYVNDIQGHVAALRPSDGKPQWIYADGCLPALFSFGGLTYLNDRIYCNNGMGELVCIDAVSHTALWRRPYYPGGVFSSGTSPAVDAGKIYVATGNAAPYVACIDAVTGVADWTQPLTCQVGAAITLMGSRLYLMRGDGRVECRNRSDGSLAWSFQTMSFTWSNMAVCGDLLIATSDDRCVYGLDLVTGNPVWRRCFAGNFARSAPFVVCDTVFVSGCAGQFYAVDGKTGETTWTYTHGSWDNFVDWAEADGNLYVADQAGRLYCFTSVTPGNPLTCACDLSANSFTPTPALSPSDSPTQAGTLTSTPTPSLTQTKTLTVTQTMTRTFSNSPSPTATPTLTFSLTPSPSPTNTPTLSTTMSLTPSPSPSITPTFTITRTPKFDDVPGGHDPEGIDEDHSAIYPNPVKDGHCRVAFRMSGPGRSKIRLFSADGDQAGIYSHEHVDGGLKSVACDLSDYAPGVYFCIVDREVPSGRSSKTKLEKFIVVK